MFLVIFVFFIYCFYVSIVKLFFVVVTGGGRVAVCVSVANVGGVIVLVLYTEVVHSTRAVSLKCLDR